MTVSPDYGTIIVSTSFQSPCMLLVLIQQAAKVTFLPTSAGLNKIFTGLRLPVMLNCLTLSLVIIY
jgi:hypothetical protein